jgi:hypothetical protein
MHGCRDFAREVEGMVGSVKGRAEALSAGLLAERFPHLALKSRLIALRDMIGDVIHLPALRERA